MALTLITLTDQIAQVHDHARVGEQQKGWGSRVKQPRGTRGL